MSDSIQSLHYVSRLSSNLLMWETLKKLSAAPHQIPISYDSRDSQFAAGDKLERTGSDEPLTLSIYVN